MPRYVWRDGAFRDPESGEPMPIPKRDGPCAPMVVSDLPGYPSPVDGKWVEGRRQRREDLKKHGCVEYEPSVSPTQGKIRNKRFAAKRGLQVSEEYRDR